MILNRINICLEKFLENHILQLKYLDFIHALFMEVNPIPVKQALNYMGKEVGGYRLPLCKMDEENAKHLKAVMEDLDLC